MSALARDQTLRQVHRAALRCVELIEHLHRAADSFRDASESALLNPELAKVVRVGCIEPLRATLGQPLPTAIFHELTAARVSLGLGPAKFGNANGGNSHALVFIIANYFAQLWDDTFFVKDGMTFDLPPGFAERYPGVLPPGAKRGVLTGCDGLNVRAFLKQTWTDLEEFNATAILAELECEFAKAATAPGGIGSQPPPGRRRKKGIPKAQANILVADYLRRHAGDPDSVTVLAISRATGVSTGQISRLPSFRAFHDERKERREQSPTKPRTVPLAEGMLAVVPDGAATDPSEEAARRELEELIREQAKDKQAEEAYPLRRRNRRS
jgi:hypothetical protein